MVDEQLAARFAAGQLGHDRLVGAKCSKIRSPGTSSWWRTITDYISEHYPETLPTHVRAAPRPNRVLDTVLMGRHTYAPALDAGITSPYAHLEQIVVSRTLPPVPDPAVRVVAEDAAAFVRKLERQPGRDIWLAGQLLSEVDDLVVKLNPVVAAAGVPLAAAAFHPHRYALRDATPLPSGVVVLRYRAAQEAAGGVQLCSLSPSPPPPVPEALRRMDRTAVRGAGGDIMDNRMRAGLVAAAVVAAGLALPVGTAGAAPGDVAPIVAGDRVVSGASPVTAAARTAGVRAAGVRAGDAAAVEAYWTPARMRAAKPAEAAPEFAAASRSRAALAPLAADTGAPVLSAPGGGSPARGGVAARATNPNLGSNHFTARTSGKVFFTKASGGNFVCSGTIVYTDGRDSVWTAGHCVHGGGSGADYHSNWTFVPGYDEDLADPAPHGRWTAWNLHTLESWSEDKDWRKDLGVATMRTRDGDHIADKLGGQGWAGNIDRHQFMNAFGYPSAGPDFDGGHLMQCAGNSTLWRSGAHENKITCDMTPGVSGGGWLKDYNGRTGYLNGVFSRVDDRDNPTIAIGPYFGDSSVVLFDGTKNN
ncbi:hypothetical protein [Spirilliplanes yamanashiensis]|uniref:Uncharacterized protein n=1 Tax=Spirilliplanes yamanashiensis TaxID=42233 RepID=A0A8J3YA26_9ACTN|nr:dihydrofolate reductase [Spirilliplanes yamanashiensis]GIJ03983.1 hypothetical protein Sya03_33350 [Spirilliplanes yamanashiensis]